MKKILAASVLLLGLLICAMPAISQTQEAPAEDVLYSYGTVSSVSGNQLAVKEYDYEQDAEVDVTYSVDPAVKFENATSLKDVAAGDIVDIDYVIKDGKKIAKLIIVEKPAAEEPPAEDIDTEEEPVVPPPPEKAE